MKILIICMRFLIYLEVLKDIIYILLLHNVKLKDIFNDIYRLNKRGVDQLTLAVRYEDPI